MYFFVLNGPAKTWYEIHEASLPTRSEFKKVFVKTFAYFIRKEKAKLNALPTV